MGAAQFAPKVGRGVQHQVLRRARLGRESDASGGDRAPGRNRQQQPSEHPVARAVHRGTALAVLRHDHRCRLEDAAASADDDLLVVAVNQAVDEVDDAMAPLPAVVVLAQRPRQAQPAIPERLVHAYRWRSELQVFACEPSSRDRLLVAFRELAKEYPVGPLFGIQGVGAAQWKEVAARLQLPMEPHAVYQAARRYGATPAMLVREAVGARSAVVHSQVRVESREDRGLGLRGGGPRRL